MERIGDWIGTRSGTKFYFRDPRPEECKLSDIAFALSNLCRYGGHVEFYSVAEHSVYVSQCLERWGCSKEVQLIGLMHDATEAYLVDVPRPIKQDLANYKEIENDLWVRGVAPAFGLPAVMPQEVHEADNAVLLAERPQLFEDISERWSVPGNPDPNVIVAGYVPVVARRFFLERYYELVE